jgi:hypothetical protein
MMPIQNQQHFLAEQFHAKDILVIKENYELFFKIKRWKFVHNLSGLSKNMRTEADNIMNNSFLSFIDLKQVLTTEGFFEAELKN